MTDPSKKQVKKLEKLEAVQVKAEQINQGLELASKNADILRIPTTFQETLEALVDKKYEVETQEKGTLIKFMGGKIRGYLIPRGYEVTDLIEVFKLAKRAYASVEWDKSKLESGITQVDVYATTTEYTPKKIESAEKTTGEDKGYRRAGLNSRTKETIKSRYNERQLALMEGIKVWIEKPRFLIANTVRGKTSRTWIEGDTGTAGNLFSVAYDTDAFAQKNENISNIRFMLNPTLFFVAYGYGLPYDDENRIRVLMSQEKRAQAERFEITDPARYRLEEQAEAIEKGEGVVKSGKSQDYFNAKPTTAKEAQSGSEHSILKDYLNRGFNALKMTRGTRNYSHVETSACLKYMQERGENKKDTRTAKQLIYAKQNDRRALLRFVKNYNNRYGRNGKPCIQFTDSKKLNDKKTTKEVRNYIFLNLENYDLKDAI